MVDMENTGEVTNTQDVSEEAAVSQEQPETNALEDFMAEIADKEQEADAQTESGEADNAGSAQGQTNETPQAKGIKGRIHAAEVKADKSGYDRGRAEALKEWEAQKAEYESRLAKYAEMELDAEAHSLAAKEHVSVDFAKRLLRAERGISAPTAPKTPAPASATNVAPDVKQRAEALYQQAQNVQAQYGIDVLDLFQKDANIKAKISSGEWDFRDVALNALSSAQKRQTQKPSPVRSGGNSRATGNMDFSNMSDDDFDRFNDQIARGAVFRPRR